MAGELYQKINWGWLNDYNGYKFAPITFVEQLYTKDGYPFLTEYNEDRNEIKSTIRNGTVNGANYLINKTGNVKFTTDANKPIRFNNGIPEKLDSISIDNVYSNINNNDSYGNYTVKAGTIVGTTINGTTINGTFNGNIAFTNPIVLNFSGTEMNSTTCTISGSNASFSVDMSLKTTGVTANSYGPSSAGQLAHEGTFSVPYITVDSKGRITSASTQTYTLPEGNRINFAADNSTTTSYVLTYPGSGQTLKYHTGVYVDHATGVLMGAAWNDYAEYRDQWENIEPGYCVSSSDNGKVFKTMEKLAPCDGIVSDTFGYAIGKTDQYQTPLAVAGRVLAYCEGDRADYHAGDTVCAGPNGKICKMTREEIKEYPDRIIGVVSEIPEYEEWNDKKVNNRIWIKVK